MHLVYLIKRPGTMFFGVFHAGKYVNTMHTIACSHHICQNHFSSSGLVLWGCFVLLTFEAAMIAIIAAEKEVSNPPQKKEKWPTLHMGISHAPIRKNKGLSLTLFRETNGRYFWGWLVGVGWLRFHLKSTIQPPKISILLGQGKITGSLAPWGRTPDETNGKYDQIINDLHIWKSCWEQTYIRSKTHWTEGYLI